jgi:lysophospholipase L1-like esterase
VSPADEPTILILGDSISMAYGPFVREQLAGAARVVRPTRDGQDENCEGTTRGVAELDRWLRQVDDPRVIVFNFGLHDLKHLDPMTSRPSDDPAHPRQAEPEVYRRQLAEIVARLRQTNAHLVFATTTPVPPGGVRPFRRVGDPMWYNAMARQIVEPYGIHVVDLYSPAVENLEEWQQPVNVHFREVGSRELARRVVDVVRPLLDKPLPPPSPLKWTADPQVVARFRPQPNANYDESAVPEYSLPPLWDSPRDAAPSREDWRARRDELVELFRTTMYGRVPSTPVLSSTANSVQVYTSLCDGGVEAREVVLTFSAAGADGKPREFSFPLQLYLPAARPGPCPTFLLIHNRQRPEVARVTNYPDGFLPVAMITQRGYAVAVFHTSDVEPDRADGRSLGIRGFFDALGAGTSGTADDWGAISAWAWGASRVLDYLRQQPEIAGDRVCVVGHSRGGKTALWAAAQDERFAGAVSNESGCAGAALSRRCYGERVERITSVFPFWFCPHFAGYAGREDALPIDQHQLLALVAPRPLYIASAAEDLWADPRGEYLALVAAAPAYAWFGAAAIDSPAMPIAGEAVFRGATGYHIRPGAHNLTEGDWIRFLDFFDAQFNDR